MLKTANSHDKFTSKEDGEEMLPDEYLIYKAQAGDRDAVNELVSRYWHPVFRFISYKIGNPEDAQELTQETFCRAFRSMLNYKNNGAFKTFLIHIAHNLIIDFWRKKSRCPTLIDINDYYEAEAEDDQPDIQAINVETREAIASLLQKLPCEQRQTIELRIIAGLPIKETALAMGKSEAAIKMLQQRALKSMRLLLFQQGIADYKGEWR